jgi:hypothetical protein
MLATHAVQSTTTASPVLYLALELSWKTWKLAFTVGAGQPPRIRSIPAPCISLLLSEIRTAKLRFGLAADAPVVACYEAGRGGFWIHRLLGFRFRGRHMQLINLDRYGSGDVICNSSTWTGMVSVEFHNSPAVLTAGGHDRERAVRSATGPCGSDTEPRRTGMVRREVWGGVEERGVRGPSRRSIGNRARRTLRS